MTQIRPITPQEFLELIPVPPSVLSPHVFEAVNELLITSHQRTRICLHASKIFAAVRAKDPNFMWPLNDEELMEQKTLQRIHIAYTDQGWNVKYGAGRSDGPFLTFDRPS